MALEIWSLLTAGLSSGLSPLLRNELRAYASPNLEYDVSLDSISLSSLRASRRNSSHDMSSRSWLSRVVGGGANVEPGESIISEMAAERAREHESTRDNSRERAAPKLRSFARSLVCVAYVSASLAPPISRFVK